MIPAILGAVAIGLTLGLLGSGGSILTVPLLVELLGHSEKSAIAESLAIVGIISAFSGARHALGKDVEWNAVVVFGPVSMVGAAIGVWLAKGIAGPVQLLLLAALMLLASVSMLRPKKKDAAKADDAPSRNIVLLALCGLFVGIATGVVGIGGGFLIVPTLVGAAGIDIRRAIGSSLVIIAMNCAVGVSGYAIGASDHPDVVFDWGVVALFGGVGIGGSIAGQTLSNRIDRAKLKRIFGVFVLLMAVYIIATRASDLLS